MSRLLPHSGTKTGAPRREPEPRPVLLQQVVDRRLVEADLLLLPALAPEVRVHRQLSLSCGRRR